MDEEKKLKNIQEKKKFYLFSQMKKKNVEKYLGKKGFTYFHG